MEKLSQMHKHTEPHTAHGFLHALILTSESVPVQSVTPGQLISDHYVVIMEIG